jgi:hypothetical protein
MFPVLFERRYRIFSSTSVSSFFMRAFETTRSFFASAKSSRSCITTVPRSWSSSPSRVTKKFSRLTFTLTSGW